MRGGGCRAAAGRTRLLGLLPGLHRHLLRLRCQVSRLLHGHLQSQARGRKLVSSCAPTMRPHLCARAPSAPPLRGRCAGCVGAALVGLGGGGGCRGKGCGRAGGWGEGCVLALVALSATLPAWSATTTACLPTCRRQRGSVAATATALIGIRSDHTTTALLSPTGKHRSPPMPAASAGRSVITAVASPGRLRSRPLPPGVPHLPGRRSW